MRISIIQSAYVPWRGFFDLIGRCDFYVIYDSAAFSKGHWHNRNRIRRKGGAYWLTIPVSTAGRLGQPIDEVTVAAPWAKRHWDIIRESYADTPGFAKESPWVKDLYAQVQNETHLSRINEVFLRAFAARLGLQVQILRDRTLDLVGNRVERLVSLCQAVGANVYLSGPAAKEYLDETVFGDAGIAVEWMTYGPYKSYAQPYEGFDGFVSVLDLLFCTGSEATKFIRPPE